MRTADATTTRLLAMAVIGLVSSALAAPAAFAKPPASTGKSEHTPPVKHPTVGQVDQSIRDLQVAPVPAQAVPGASLVLQTPPADPPKPRLAQDTAAHPPEKTVVAWKLDYPMPGEFALGRWQVADKKAIGAVATFPFIAAE